MVRIRARTLRGSETKSVSSSNTLGALARVGGQSIESTPRAADSVGGAKMEMDLSVARIHNDALMLMPQYPMRKSLQSARLSCKMECSGDLVLEVSLLMHRSHF